MIKRYGCVPLAGQHYRPRPGAYAILPRNGEVLLTYQAAPHDEYQLPGGGIDAGEGAIAALHREVMEETGWRIARPRRLGAFRRFVYMPDYGFHAEKICHVYLAHPVCPIADPTEEGHLAIWMPIEQAIIELANDGDADYLAALLG